LLGSRDELFIPFSAFADYEFQAKAYVASIQAKRVVLSSSFEIKTLELIKFWADFKLLGSRHRFITSQAFILLA